MIRRHSRPLTTAYLAAEPAHLQMVFDANPELRAAWHDAKSYREAFAWATELTKVSTEAALWFAYFLTPASSPADRRRSTGREGRVESGLSANTSALRRKMQRSFFFCASL
jgi:hypothetical protein